MAHQTGNGKGRAARTSGRGKPIEDLTAKGKTVKGGYAAPVHLMAAVLAQKQKETRPYTLELGEATLEENPPK